MTKTTNVSSKTELLNLTVKLGNELTSLEGEVTSIQSKLKSVTNIDGMNFQGAAQLISNNLTSVLGALQSLQGTVNAYASQLQEFDQYEDPGVNPDLTTPEMGTPGTNPEPGTNPDSGTNPDPGTNPNPNTNPNPSPNPNPTPSPNPTPNPKPNPNPNPGGGEDGGGTPDPGTPGPGTPTEPETPKWEPVELNAEDISFGVGDPNIDVSNYTNNPEAGYTVTTGNMSYGLNTEDYNLLCAVVAAESDGTYDGTMSVISAILNRCEDSNFKSQFGMDPIAQITATNQFSGYTSGEFQQYLGNTSGIVHQVVGDALAGVRNHTSCNY